MTRLIFLLLSVFVVCVIHGEAAKILVMFPMPAPSHFSLGNTLAQELDRKGHEVTLVSKFKAKAGTKLRNIVLDDMIFKFSIKDVMDFSKNAAATNILSLFNFTESITDQSISHPKIQKLLQSKEHFDLVIIEAFLSEAHVAFAHHFNCPLIVISPVGASMFSNHYVGNLQPPTYVPQMMLGYTKKMSFLERVHNVLITYTLESLLNWVYIPRQEQMIKKYFPTAPSYSEIVKERMALVLANSHPSIGIATPTVPNFIQIGGYHIVDPKPLPNDLKEYLDAAKQGFILFSMGSNINSTMLPVETREMLMRVFSELPYKILWKFEDDQLPGKPDNVKIGKWLPQNDILAHPNLRLFITHGGLLSTTEAIYHGVPIVGIPVLGDQKMNMKLAEQLQIGKTIEFTDLNYKGLKDLILEVLGNKIYREKVRERSELFRDQPMRPLDSAMYWIEYVLRHGYCRHLQTGAMSLAWYEQIGIDIMAFFASVAVLFTLAISAAIKFCCCRGKQTQKNKATNKKKD